MKAQYYIGLEDGTNFAGPFTLEQIDEKIKADESVEEKIFRITRQPGIGHGYEHVRYADIPRFTVEFQPEIGALIAARNTAASTVLSGPNNSGKSLVLKHLFGQLGHRSCLLTCNRFSQIDVINTRVTDPAERKRLYENLKQQHEHGRYHEDIGPRQLDQLISVLNNTKRKALFKLAGELLDSKVSLQKTEKDNLMSPWYVDIDSQSLKVASSGTRLLFTLLGNLFDEYFQIVLIDEPEIGLSPRIQAALARALYDPATRAEYFPHLKQVFVVTHSHLFLDHAVLSNNFIVEKAGETVSVRQVHSVAALHELQFRMLGNDLSHLYMPAAVVVVEGKSDTSFLAKLFALHIPNRRISIAIAHGAGGAPDKVQTLSEGFGELQTSPYQRRIFVLLDSRQSTKRASLLRQGVLDDHIHTWTKNGIEWFYPKPHVAAAFMCTEAELAGVNLEADPITVNSITLSKAKLAEAVVARTALGDLLDAEVTAFLDKVKCATS